MDIYKQQKETENKIHDGLFGNLLFLSGFYPTSKEFNALFRRDMFVKNNKAAFFEVIHYLLNILNPELTKKTLTNWPPYDLKREAKFRSEVVGYINTLNSTYESADIPICQASSLISPGGFRFAKFLLKISQLVIFEHIKRHGEYTLLHHIRPHKHFVEISNAQKCRLEKETMMIEYETKEMLKHFNKNYEDAKEKGNEIQTKLEQLNKDIFKGKQMLEETQQEFNTKYPLYPSFENLEEKLVNLKQQTEKVLELERLFSSSEKLLTYLGGSTMTLEHNEDNFVVPSDISYIITDRKELNLGQFFQGLTVLLEKKALELQSPTVTCMQETKEILENHHAQEEMTLRQLESEQERVNKILDDLREGLQGVNLLQGNQ